MTAVAEKTGLGPYARLAKLDMFDYYLGLPLVWALLAPPMRTDGSVVTTLLLFGAGEVLVIVAMVALDDLTGYRDGSDLHNYRPDAPARRLARKPLVAGTLSERQVVRFSGLTAIAGAVVWTAALVTAPHSPLWTVLLVVVTYFFSLQYSWGLKLSYRGFQEFFLAALGWAVVLAPYGLVTGDVTGFVMAQAVVFGLGPLLVGVYSNTNDIEGDRGVGRPTVAALTGPRGNMLFVAALSVFETAVIAAAPWLGGPWWFPLALLPTIALRAWQLWLGFEAGDILRARKLGMWLHRLTVVLFVGVDLMAIR
ncbi:UbiA family prenyltransferase [Amycolatopsis sp. cg5]|uniref:UbiA family prenyltransferase n=1 Tax=Amycolatopsis sp. cg5 TaxID=3238802 RepID=UPI00352462EC